MNYSFLIQILRYIFFVLLQVLVLNHIQLHNILNPYAYILFILILPFNASKISVLLYAFLIGITIDIFSGTEGIHASAATVVGYLRRYVLQFLASPEEYAENKYPSIKKFGFNWFFSYIGILTIIHHLSLFFLEIFRFNEIGFVLFKSLVSALFSIVVMTLLMFLFYEKKNNAIS